MQPDSKLLYVELKTSFEANGLAWIGRGIFSRTRRTLYFHNMVLQKNQCATGNFLDVESGQVYWVSGVKINERNRLFGSRRPVLIDRNVVEEYLRHIGRKELPASQYKVLELIKKPAKSRNTILQNTPHSPAKPGTEVVIEAPAHCARN